MVSGRGPRNQAPKGWSHPPRPLRCRSGLTGAADIKKKVLAHATAVDGDLMALGTGLRNAIGVLTALLLGIAFDQPAAGAAAAGGAIVAGVSDVGDRRGGRAETMLVASVAGAFSMLVGALVANSEPLALLATGLWGFGAGLPAAVGPVEGTLGIMVTLALVLVADDPSTPSQAGEIAALALAGGLFQTLLGVLIRTRTPLHGAAASRSEFRAKISAATPKTEAGRHAIRLGLALVAATVIYRLLPLDRGYWVTLTVLFVMRPGPVETWLRVGERFVGTVAGVGLATLAVAVLEPSKTVTALIAAVFFVPTFAFLRANHLIFSVALAAAIVSFTTVLGVPERSAAVSRVIDVVIGLVIVAAALVAIPRAPAAQPVARPGRAT
jgi:uncharacterized membrane protein YccC